MIRFTPSIRRDVFASLLTSVAGCSSSGSVARPDYGSEEGRKIAEFVDYFNDYKADANKFKKSFAGNAPSNWKEYEQFRYEVKVGSPKVDGTSATATVNIYKESNHEVIATKEWTFTKVGETWKIKDAPAADDRILDASSAAAGSSPRPSISSSWRTSAGCSAAAGVRHTGRHGHRLLADLLPHPPAPLDHARPGRRRPATAAAGRRAARGRRGAGRGPRRRRVPRHRRVPLPGDWSITSGTPGTSAASMPASCGCTPARSAAARSGWSGGDCAGSSPTPRSRAAGWATGWVEADSVVALLAPRARPAVLLVPVALLVTNLSGLHRDRVGKLAYLASVCLLYTGFLLSLRFGWVGLGGRVRRGRVDVPRGRIPGDRDPLRPPPRNGRQRRSRSARWRGTGWCSSACTSWRSARSGCGCRTRTAGSSSSGRG